MNDDAAALGQSETLHPLSLLSSLRASLRDSFGMFAAGGYFAVKGYWQLLLLLLALYAVVSIGAAVLRWRKFSFRVGAREIRIDSGVISRNHRSIPFDRIQDVTIEQGPLARALGLARVRFETGGSAAAKEDDGSLAAVSLQRATEIRDLVRTSRGLSNATPVEGIAETEATPIFAMDLKRVLLAGVFNFSLAVIGGLIGLTQTIGDPIGFDPFKRAFWMGIFAPGTPIGDFVMAHQVVTIAAGVVSLLVIGLGTGLLRTASREHGFRLDRTAVGLRRRRGLFTLSDVTLPAKRTQAAIVATGPVRARFGWAALKLQSLAKEDGGKGDHVVAPLAQSDEIAAVLEAIDWRGPGNPQWKRVSAAYVSAFAVLLVPLLLAATVNAFFVPPLGIAAIASLTGALAVRVLAWRRHAYCLDDQRLLVRSGWWRRRLAILPCRNIQSVDYQQNFVDRAFGAADLVIGVAGGGASGISIRALPVQTARHLRDILLSRFA